MNKNISKHEASQIASAMGRRAEQSSSKERMEPANKYRDYIPCQVVAEIGCNHQGDIDIAKEMINSAKLAGVDFCKFQKKSIDDYPEWKNNLYNSENSFGETYYDHRKYLEFTIEQHMFLKKYCEKIGVDYSCSVWDLRSAKEIISLNPIYIKIPSARNNDYELLEYVYSNYNKYIHISMGMASREEREELYNYLNDKKNRTVIYWTTSDYPAKFEDLFLLEIKDIVKRFKYVGYSSHNLGIAVSLITYVLGVHFIEHHFTLDRTMKGTDHSASLEPTGMKKICRDLKVAEKSLTYKGDNITDGEQINRNKLRRE